MVMKPISMTSKIRSWINRKLWRFFWRGYVRFDRKRDDTWGTENWLLARHRVLVEWQIELRNKNEKFERRVLFGNLPELEALYAERKRRQEEFQKSMSEILEREFLKQITDRERRQA